MAGLTTADTPTTARQREVLKAIAGHYAEHGCPPTIRDIMHAVGIRSPNGVVQHLDALAKRGLVALTDGTARGVSIPAIAAATRAAAAEYAKGVEA